VTHAVREAGTRKTADFQVTPSGRYAAFSTAQPLDPGYENNGHTEVYRYDGALQELDCASCNPTNAKAAGDASLATNGLSLTDDGRVFFDSDDSLVLRDANNRKDVYQWGPDGLGNCEPPNPNHFASGICLSLISSGSSPFDSSLLSTSADGTDAYFFTHDTLARQDHNGPVTKIYDARENGGFFDVPPPARCAASDECHGPGTVAANPPPIRTVIGSPGNFRSKKCKNGQIRKRNRCVKRNRRLRCKKGKRRQRSRCRKKSRGQIRNGRAGR
jgi:hypothetical protein